MRRIEGKVALVTGAASALGRAIASRLAAEGAELIAVHPAATSAPHFQSTIKQLESLAPRVSALELDLRDPNAAAALGDAVAELGGCDIVSVNPVPVGTAPATDLVEEQWQGALDGCLGGAWRAIRAIAPTLVAREGGAVVLSGSVVARKAVPELGHLAAASAGLEGLARTLSAELGPEMIRVNVLLTAAVAGEDEQNQAFQRAFGRLVGEGADVETVHAELSPLRAGLVDPAEPAAAVAWLVSDEARYVSGTTIRVDAGWGNR